MGTLSSFVILSGSKILKSYCLAPHHPKARALTKFIADLPEVFILAFNIFTHLGNQDSNILVRQSILPPEGNNIHLLTSSYLISLPANVMLPLPSTTAVSYIALYYKAF